MKDRHMNAKIFKRIARTVLGGALVFAGMGHLTFARKEFRAQVPDWIPLPKDNTVVYSGWIEIALGTALVLANSRYQKAVGKTTAGFFAAVFPGNISQYLNRRNGFGLDTDGKRLARLFFQPVLIYWALKSSMRCLPKKVRPDRKAPCPLGI